MVQSGKKQTLLKTLLLFQTAALVVYTVYAVNNEGWSLFRIFTGNITALSWDGQFNLDFSCYLTLSGLWIMWRNQFSRSSVIIAIIATVIGIIVFAPYLLFLLVKEKGDIRKVLVGNHGR